MLRTWRQRFTVTDVFIWVIGLSIAGVVIWGTISTLDKASTQPASGSTLRSRDWRSGVFTP